MSQGFRRLLISTPDHWHALITVPRVTPAKMFTARKPLSLMVQEGRKNRAPWKLG